MFKKLSLFQCELLWPNHIVPHSVGSDMFHWLPVLHKLWQVTRDSNTISSAGPLQCSRSWVPNPVDIMDAIGMSGKASEQLYKMDVMEVVTHHIMAAMEDY